MGDDLSAELMRAALPRAVLTLLSVKPQHGYMMLEVLQSHGFGQIKGGTLYPLFRRLEEQGLVDHAWEHDVSGPGRKIFSLTPTGHTELKRSTAAWNRMNEILDRLRSGNQNPQ